MCSGLRTRKSFFLILPCLAPLITLLFSVMVYAAQAARKVPKVPTSPWQKLSDHQIARMFFPKEKLYFQAGYEGITEDLSTTGWGVVVHNVKRVVANLDSDPEEEMAVQIVYGTGWCTSCGGQVIVAILDKKNDKVRVAWSTKEHGAWNRDDTTDISTLKLIRKDKFYELALVINSSPLSFQPHKEIRIIRWDGNKFSTIWSHDLESFSGGERSDIPHDYLAKLDFLDDNREAKRIRVTSIYVTWPLATKQRQVKLTEEFVWSDAERKYVAASRYEHRYEKGELCVSSKQLGREDYRDCRNMAYGRGLNNWQAGRFEQAISDFTEAIENDPKLADAYFYRGSAYQRKGQYDQAISDYTKALEINPKHTQAYIERANTYGRKGEYDRAISEHTNALEINPQSPSPYYYRAQAYERKGQYDEAISDYTKMFDLTPGGPWNYIERGSVYYKKGAYELAISDYTKALGMKPLPVWAYYVRGLAYWKKGDYEQALNDLNKAVMESNITPEAYYYRGRVYMDKREYEPAISDFDRVMETPPKSGEFYPDTTQIYFSTAQAYERLGQTRKAINAYRAVIQYSRSSTSPLAAHAKERIAELEKK